MNAQIRPAPVRKSILVNAPQDRAFQVFTTGIGRWWPKSHKIGRADLDRPVIEPKEGGRWYELDVDGSQCEIGRVAVWDPPARLVLIWQLTPEFAYDPHLITEVELLFTPQGGGTRVELEHRHLERMGEKADAMRETVSGPGGWPALLQLFANEAQT
ncbi:MAG TPA: SRPBCC family protein [Sphingomicrobium sp.]|nr:SRPBCC family protein [Sphingomicrobium sp.]